MELAKIKGDYPSGEGEQKLLDFSGFVLKRNNYIEGLVTNNNEHKYIVGLNFDDGGIAFYMISSNAKEIVAFLGIKNNSKLKSHLYDIYGNRIIKKAAANIKFEIQAKSNLLNFPKKPIEETINTCKDSLEIYKELYFKDNADFEAFWAFLTIEQFKQIKAEYESTIINQRYKEMSDNRKSLTRRIFHIQKR
ncbi:MAG: hypothetical protein PHQ89_00785 [Bacilli bacterium]|nr:hypothetical protein [Bacilli bacterium]